MRKILVTALIGIHLFGNTEFVQLLKLPNLVHHYFSHARINPNLSFAEFMMDHYGGDDGTNADDDFDKQLPCHSTQTNTLAHIFSPMLAEQPVLKAIPAVAKDYNSCLQSGTPSEHVLLIIQPPRFSC